MLIIIATKNEVLQTKNSAVKYKMVTVILWLILLLDPTGLTFLKSSARAWTTKQNTLINAGKIKGITMQKIGSVPISTDQNKRYKRLFWSVDIGTDPKNQS